MPHWEHVWNRVRCSKSIVIDNRRELTKSQPAPEKTEQLCSFLVPGTTWSQQITTPVSGRRTVWRKLRQALWSGNWRYIFQGMNYLTHYALTMGHSTQQQNSNNSVSNGNLSTSYLPCVPMKQWEGRVGSTDTRDWGNGETERKQSKLKMTVE